MYGLYHDCARTLKRSLAGKLAIVQLSSGFGFARNSSRVSRVLACLVVRVPATLPVSCTVNYFFQEQTSANEAMQPIHLLKSYGGSDWVRKLHCVPSCLPLHSACIEWLRTLKSERLSSCGGVLM